MYNNIAPAPVLLGEGLLIKGEGLPIGTGTGVLVGVFMSPTIDVFSYMYASLGLRERMLMLRHFLSKMIEVHTHTYYTWYTLPLPPSLPPGIKPCYVVFDVLMINDDNFANIPLKDRVTKLNK